jgi:hypothetical protein
MMKVLTPKSPRWDEFADALYEALYGPNGGCDGDIGQAGPTKVHGHAKQIMTAMGGVDIPASLKFFASKGGYCDCEILLNVDPD